MLQEYVMSWSLSLLQEISYVYRSQTLLAAPPALCLISSITLFRGLTLLCAIGNKFAPLKL